MSSPTWYTRRPCDEVVALEVQTLAAPRFDIYVGHTTMAAMLFLTQRRLPEPPRRQAGQSAP